MKDDALRSGVLIVDKGRGVTSFDVVALARRRLGVRRIGHAGTLDPDATGVLPILIGEATKLTPYLVDHDKEYLATIRLGVTTDTYDVSGRVLAEKPVPELSVADLEEVCGAFVGRIKQVPPMYSAIHHEGRRLYELAREGVDVEREAAEVTVDTFEVRGLAGDRVEVAVTCSPGTYVRALARDVGEALGVGGHLVALRRTRSGDFGLDGAVDGAAPAPGWERSLLPMGALLPGLPAVEVGPEGAAALRHGRDLTARLLASAFPPEPRERFRVLDEAGLLLALAVPKGFGPAAPGLEVEPVLHPEIVLAD